MAIFYGEAWALVHFLTFGPGMITGERTKLTEFNTLLQEGTEQKKAFRQVFGDPAELQKNLELYLRRLAVTAAVFKSPPKIDEKSFVVHKFSMAESEGQLGSYLLWGRDLSDALPLRQIIGVQPLRPLPSARKFSIRSKLPCSSVR